MSALSEAIAESYASGDDGGVDLIVFQLDYPTFPGPVLAVSGVDIPPGETWLLPTEDGGAPVPHTPIAFEYTPPGFDKDGATDGKIRIDNVSGELNEYLQGATGAAGELSVIIRRFHVKKPPNYVTPTIIDEELTGLVIRSVTLTASTAEGTLMYPDVREENFPKAVYTPDEYPGLVGM
jgi:hypothetical protein